MRKSEEHDEMKNIENLEESKQDGEKNNASVKGEEDGLSYLLINTLL